MSRKISNQDAVREWEFDNIIWRERKLKEEGENYVNDRFSDYIDLKQSSQKRIKAKIDLINEIVRPTASKITVPAIQKEIAHRVYRHSINLVDDLELCLQRQIDLHDQNKCVTQFEKGVDTHVIPWLFGMLREY